MPKNLAHNSNHCGICRKVITKLKLINTFLRATRAQSSLACKFFQTDRGSFSLFIVRVVVKKTDPNPPGFFLKAHLKETIKPTKKTPLYFSFEKSTNKQKYRTCGLVVRALASCPAGSCQDLKSWNLLQSGQALGIMTVAGKFSNADAIFVGVRSCCLLPVVLPTVGVRSCCLLGVRSCCLLIGITSSKTKCVRLRNGRSLQHPKLNKSLPGRSSMPLEGQFLCCAVTLSV